MLRATLEEQFAESARLEHAIRTMLDGGCKTMATLQLSPGLVTQ